MSTSFSPIDRSYAAAPLGFSGAPSDAVMLNYLWSAIAQAAHAQLQRTPMMSGQLPSFSAASLAGMPRQATGRALPQVVGGNGLGQVPANLGYRGSQTSGNGGIDMGALLMRQLLAACPPSLVSKLLSTPTGESNPMPGVVDQPTVSDPGSSPSDTATGDPTVCPPPVDPVTCEPPTSSGAKKVFILGDLKKFGGGTVRRGLEDLLRSTTQADRKGERTHSKLSPEDAAKVKALLESTDPAVRATLATKVPNKKSLVISEDGKILDTLSTKDVVNNSSLGVGVHAQHMNDGQGRNFDRSAGGTVQAAGQTYDVAGTELHSPIKITLDGKDAQLNSTNGFAIDLNGFQEKGGRTTTSGGLNANEAWLVRDKAGDGVKKNGVVDGNDVYGDHNGQFKDGYDQLARDYASEIKVDANGKRYIDLTDPNSKAGKELQLLDAQGNLRPAKDVLTRIDVDELDPTAKDETDGKGNVITARGNVTYKDGRTATSADQWYTTGTPTRG